ncbi:calcium-dependent protein kinase 19 [Pycnococcus provasolii]|uniref:Calcium-dependent protein kinase 19 n=1 Tax=Pycnococcus provasolii TaxID=41880 RepID=A0A830I0Z7_9CHLO|nr:calcium-dependent protein kinase 19 [Pycnococcus provasolii]|mmetsp:Transcript_8141/g.21527  ORF Transcript_8141/g.21527 Transcript_8141/m.21527 type:complete len:329 (+) Transcript_8141:826-1812(+)
MKPENFLLRDKSDNAELMLTDFGLSVFVKPGIPFKDIVGSAYYVAPEVLRKNYGMEADVWSIGIILYILLSGVPPFWAEQEPQIFDAILKADLDFSTKPWPAVSQQAKEVVAGMLTRDPRQRWTIQQVLDHPWMKGNAKDTPLDSVVLKRLTHFSKMNKLKRRALQIIAGTMTPDEIAGLKNMFEAIDRDRSGSITFNELKEGLAKQGCKASEEQLHDLMGEVDADGNGTLNLEEFIAATMHIYNAVNDEKIVSAFRALDKDGSGFLTLDELEEALKTSSGDMNAQELKKLVEEIDRNKDGKIDYEEFASMMRDELPGLKQLRSRVHV